MCCVWKRFQCCTWGRQWYQLTQGNFKPQDIRGCCTTTKKINRSWCKLSDCKFMAKSNKSWTFFSGFLVEHNLPLSTVDHTAKLFRNIFPNSKIVNKYRCGRKKTTHLLTGTVAKQITSNLKEDPLLTRWYGLATGGSYDEDDKCLPVLVEHVDKDSRLIATSLFDMPNIKRAMK